MDALAYGFQDTSLCHVDTHCSAAADQRHTGRLAHKAGDLKMCKAVKPRGHMTVQPHMALSWQSPCTLNAPLLLLPRSNFFFFFKQEASGFALGPAPCVAQRGLPQDHHCPCVCVCVCWGRAGGGVCLSGLASLANLWAAVIKSPDPEIYEVKTHVEEEAPTVHEIVKNH